MSSGDNQAVQDVKPEQEPEVTPHVSEEEPAPERKEENCEVKQEQESDVKVKTEVTDETADVGLENELSKLTVDSQVMLDIKWLIIVFIVNDWLKMLFRFEWLTLH